jgi:hypothetical protein
VSVVLFVVILFSCYNLLFLFENSKQLQLTTVGANGYDPLSVPRLVKDFIDLESVFLDRV